MNRLTLEQIEPKEEVTIQYKDVAIGTYEMNLQKNQLLNYHENSETCRILNNPLHQLGQNDLKEFLEDHIKEIGRDSQTCPIDKISVDGHTIFVAKNLDKGDTILSTDQENKAADKIRVPGAELITLQDISPKDSIEIRYNEHFSKDDYGFTKKQNDVSRMSVSHNEFIPSEKGGIHLWMMDYEGPRGEITPGDLKNFLRYAVNSDNSLVKEGKPNDISEIYVDGKLVFDLSQESNKTVVLGMSRDEKENVSFCALNGMGKELASGVFPRGEPIPSLSQEIKKFTKAMRDASYVVGFNMPISLFGLKKINVYLPKTKPYVECMEYRHEPFVKDYLKARESQQSESGNVLSDARKEAAALLGIYRSGLQKIVMQDKNACHSLDEIMESKKRTAASIQHVISSRHKGVGHSKERML